jgi:hypothetical protein
MIQIAWVVAGVIVGMLIAAVMSPPPRKEVTVPQPHDPSVYHTDTGCVRLRSSEVACTDETDSFNLLASVK